MSGSVPYIGSKISLITSSDIRYEGILFTLNKEDATIAVQNVRSFGTEGRRLPEVPISNEIYDFIIFRGEDLKNITVLQSVPEQRAPQRTYAPDYSDSLYAIPPTEPSWSAPPAPAPLRPSVAPVGGLGGCGPQSVARNGYPGVGSSLGGPLGPGPYPSVGAFAGPPAPASSASRAPEKPTMPSPADTALSSGAPGLHRQPFSAAPESHHSAHAAAHVALLSEDRPVGDRGDPKARGRGGKGTGPKKPLSEVLRYHNAAQEAITKMMKNQNSSALPMSELRSMSEQNPHIFHFYLDFVNYCCPSHAPLSDEQQWDSLAKALKIHFEKEFGSNPKQKPAQPQRPNNTLGDFITVETASKTKKGAKLATRTGGGGVGRGPGRGPGKGEKKDVVGLDADGPGTEESPGGSSWVCPRCTLRNEAVASECAACGFSKQQAANWAEFPPL